MGEIITNINTPEAPQQYLHWRAVAEDFSLDQFPQKRNRLQIVIQNHFNAHSTPTRNITGVEKNEIENYITINIGDNLYYFDIYSEQFCGNTLDEANEFRLQNPNREISNILTGIPVLEQLMQNNANDGVFGSFLNNNDTVDFNSPEIFSGMTARELQMTLRGNIRTFEINGGLQGLDIRQREQVSEVYKLYLEIVMGIGETYEDASGFFHITENEVDMYMRSTIYSFSSSQECIDYYTYIQTQIYENNRTSKKNKEAYKIFSQKLGTLIFERLQREFLNSQDDDEKQNSILQESVYFIKLITERSDIDINNDLRNPALAEEICIFVISRQGGVLDSIENCTRYSLDFMDPVVNNRSPENIITNVSTKLSKCGIQNTSYFLSNQLGISTRAIISTKNNSYNDLSLNHKREISILARLIVKIDNGDLSPSILSEKSENETSTYIKGLANNITEEAYSAVQEAYDKNFDPDSYGGRPIYTPPDFMNLLQEMNIDQVDIDAFELFNDIRGNGGFMNFSDESLNLAGSLSKSAGIIVGTIAIVMIATAVTGGLALPAIAPSLIASGGGLTLAGALTSIGVGASMGTLASIGFLDPRKHDSMGEMFTDIATDFTINTFHAIYMEKLTMTLWQSYGVAGKTGLIGGDLGSGIEIEVVREKMINAMFQGSPLLGENHSTTLEEAFWGLNFKKIENLPQEIQNRFLQASHIYYLWNGEDVSIADEEEFQDINWEREEMETALIKWIERQEQRI